MKANELSQRTTDDLNYELANLKEELFNLRFQHATGQLENPMRIRQVKKDYARIKTVLRLRELNAANI
ncbi:MAG: 50S ribosomal protein L29 [Eubacteriaceae bacterium]|nr:50S ribosomal protein L29 [Eubacteriaceae bacterium]